MRIYNVLLSIFRICNFINYAKGKNLFTCNNNKKLTQAPVRWHYGIKVGVYSTFSGLLSIYLHKHTYIHTHTWVINRYVRQNHRDKNITLRDI